MKKTILISTAALAMMAGAAFADNNRGCNASCQINALPNSATKSALKELNNEDQRLVDGNFNSGSGTLTLYTQDMNAGADNDISRRAVTVGGFENLRGADGRDGADGADGANGADGVVDYTRVDTQDRAVLAAANEHSDANDVRVLEAADQNAADRDAQLEMAINRYSSQSATNLEYSNSMFNSMNARMDGFDGRLASVESLAQSNRSGIAGTAALANIDFVEHKFAVGFGLSTWDGTTGYAVKGMLPINDNWHGNIGVFGADKDYGAAVAVVYTFN